MNRSPFCQWLLEFQEIASKDNIIIEARHFDILDFYFLSKLTPEDAWPKYLKFRSRWYAINGTELPVSSNLQPIDPNK